MVLFRHRWPFRQFLLTVGALVCLGACTLPVLQPQPQNELPEYVHIQPPPARYKDASVGIMAFASPPACARIRPLGD